MINGNRQLNASKIKRIKQDINDGLDVLRYCPVLCIETNGKLDIIDGQHRFWVAKELKCPVWYVLVENFTLHDIARINSNTEKWKQSDYINCYVQQGNIHYQQLQDFLDKYAVPMSVALKLLTVGSVNHGAGLQEDAANGFKRGEFKVKTLKEAKEFMEQVSKFCEFKHYLSRPFLVAVDLVLKAGKCDFEELVGKFNIEPKQLQQRNSYKEYLANLEVIYNRGFKNRRTIF